MGASVRHIGIPIAQSFASGASNSDDATLSNRLTVNDWTKQNEFRATSTKYDLTMQFVTQYQLVLFGSFTFVCAISGARLCLWATECLCAARFLPWLVPSTQVILTEGQLWLALV